MPKTLEAIQEGSVDIAVRGEPPLRTFSELAEDSIHLLVGYRRGPEPLLQQDIDFLARRFQAVYEVLQDREVE